MILAGLDQAPSGTGFCVGDGADKPAFGYREFSEYGSNEAALMIHVRDWFRQFAKSSGIEAVCTEQIIVRPGKTLHMPTLHRQFCVVHAIAMTAGDLGIAHYEAGVTEWRMEFLETSRAPKNAPEGWLKDRARLQCLKRGWLVESHHVAEAIGIWDWCLAKLDRHYRQKRGIDHRRAMLELQREAA